VKDRLVRSQTSPDTPRGDTRPDTRLDLVDLRKHYGDTKALDGLTLTARSGEVLGIAGPNGAGKSTLVAALAKEIELDGGEISFRLSDAPDSASYTPRVAVVHQETSLFSNLTVVENLCVARPSNGSGYPRGNNVELAILEEMGLYEYAHHPIADCSLVVRQLTEIARAFAHEEADILLLDEPNSALTADESATLFEHVARLKAANRIVLLVTHRLTDLVEQADRVAVVRDGRIAIELAGEKLTETGIARELVVGAAVHSTSSTDRGATQGHEDESAGGRRLEVRGWSHQRRRFTDVNLGFEGGQITAIVGSEGSGARQLLRSLGGFDRAKGSLALLEAGHADPDATVEYTPAERRVSLFTNLTVAENLASRLGAPHIATRAGRLSRANIMRLGQSLMARFLIRGGGLDNSVRTLSGGNQQKTAIASAVATDPKVLLLEEPTRGVDIGSKSEIYRILRAYARAGAVVVCYCSELPEVFDVADQVVVVEDGRVIGHRRVADFDTVAQLAHTVTDDVVRARDVPGDLVDIDRNAHLPKTQE
jgi:ABC-type sugar transport system ATPase subunit